MEEKQPVLPSTRGSLLLCPRIKTKEKGTAATIGVVYNNPLSKVHIFPEQIEYELAG
jgi:hypothetical protein